MKKLLGIVVGITLTVCMFAGCSNGSSQNAGLGISDKIFNPQKDEIKIEQIDWKVENAVIDKHRRVVFSYTNKSKFKIAEIELDFSLKSDVTQERLREVCEAEGWPDQVLNQISNFSSNQLANLTLAGEWKQIVAPEETSGEEGMTIGMRYINGMKQYDLFEPSMMIIRYLGENGSLYEETYDFKTSSYSLSSTVVDTRQWSDSKLATLLPQPENLLVTEIEDDSSYLEFETTGTTPAEYKDYISTCKGMGFTKDLREDSTDYYARSEDDKYKLAISYWEDLGKMTVYVEEL